MRIAIPDLVSPSYFAAIAAVELGFFKDEGLDAELELIFPVPKTFQALKEREVDFVAGSAHAVVTAFPSWEGAKLLAALARHMYWFLVVRSDLHIERGDVQALRGLRIGAASGPDAGLRLLLEDAGVDAEAQGIQIGPVPGMTASNVSFGVSAARALEAKELDGFWANGMGCEVAIRRGIGTLIVDARRGDGPPAARDYTFAALAATEERIEKDPGSIRAAIHALRRTHQALREDVGLATEVGRRRFPPAEAELIAELIERDLPYYDVTIGRDACTAMTRFSQKVGFLSGPVPYEKVVAVDFRGAWTEPL